jgi:hypothetical protein
MQPTKQDLDWLAFRYVAGEMTDDESAAFELRLADDQLARDAVVEAVQLGECIVAIESQTPVVAVASAPAQGRWMEFFLAAAACGLLIATVAYQSGERSSPGISDQVAEAWSQRLDTDWSDIPGDDFAVNPEESDVPEAGETAMTSDVPDWMLEAVRSLQSMDQSEQTNGSAAEKLEG